MNDKRKIIAFVNLGGDPTELEVITRSGAKFDVKNPTLKTLVRIERLTYDDNYNTAAHIFHTCASIFITKKH